MSYVLHAQCFCDALPQRMNYIAIQSIVWHHDSPNSSNVWSSWRIFELVCAQRYVKPYLVDTPTACCYCTFQPTSIQRFFCPSLWSNTLSMYDINVYIILLCCQGFIQEFFFVSAEVCNSRNWNSGSIIASFERRLRGEAPTPLPLPCPFRTSTWTRTDEERDQREVAKVPHVEEEFGKFWLNLNGCNAWIIYKFCIIFKRYLIMFGILRWHVQPNIVWSQIVHQVFNCTRPDDLQNWYHLQTVLTW